MKWAPRVSAKPYHNTETKYLNLRRFTKNKTGLDNLDLFLKLNYFYAYMLESISEIID